ncbi:hypothetical protein DXH95_02980 [Sphingorhabdus pulchriflava]|uniref:Uncharacterized protein n=1 Tax=Sphingorhabdus pulchriflava TaxID=2292257 RepID=A0A371BFM7_9SPHN|nr:hypothetical protein [Sphingorhabdus pulchriflava]RDV06405.1 hypothetical protein DXH95_02980 [Sphingorhabdus pulchriflava]
MCLQIATSRHGARAFAAGKVAHVGTPPVAAFDTDEPLNIYGSWQADGIAVLTVVEVVRRGVFQRTMRVPARRLARMGAAARRALNAGDIGSPTLMAEGTEFLRGELRAIERVANQMLAQREG